MNFKKAVLEDPFAKAKAQSTKDPETMKAPIVSGSDDYYGACSLETFSSSSGLSLTHEDAQGFLDYPTQFPGKAANFWRKDAGVQVWKYEETFDNWQDTYGMDAVMVFYHSGHGGMDNNGVFSIPLGSKWDNRDRAYSNNMAFSNEELRYLFWSTCFSLRVSGSHSPIRTWADPNKGGLRMLFGYETTSIDHAGYGSYFWEEWNKGKTFTRAFLDASWRISHGQVAVVMASGSDQADATNRLNNERFFSRTAAAKNWYQWQWIGTVAASAMKSPKKVPKELNSLILDPKFAEDERLSKIANEVGVTRKDAGTIHFDADGNRMVSSKDVQATVNDQGALNVHFGKGNAENTNLLNQDKAVKLAEKVIKDLGLGKGIEMTLGNTRHKFTCGGTSAGSGKLEKEAVIETVIQFRQTHNDVQSVNSDHGLIAVSIDNDGRVLNIYDSTKLVVGEIDQRTTRTSSPADPKKAAGPDVERHFQKKIERLKAEGEGKATVIREVVGYDLSSSVGTVVRQKDVEIDFGKEVKKRFKVRVQLV